MYLLGTILLVLFLYGFPLTSWFMPWSNEFAALLQHVIPWAPLLIGLYLAQPLIGGVNAILGNVGRLVLGVFSAILFVVLIFPVMIADTFLLGDLAHWMWKHQAAPLVLVVLSGLALYVRGQVSEEFIRKYLITAVIVGVATIVLGYLGDSWMNSSRITFTVRDGKVYSDPAEGIWVKGGDHLTFTAFGQVKSSGKSYGPQGDLLDVIGYGPKGELQFLISQRGGRDLRLPVQDLKSGAEEIAGFDMGYLAGGYRAKGEVWIPEGLEGEGRLSVAFHALVPEFGSLRFNLRVNPEASVVGRMQAQTGNIAVFWTLGFVLLLAGAVGYLYFLVPAPVNKFVPVLGGIVAVIVFFNVMDMATKVTGINVYREMGELVPSFPGGSSATAAPRPGLVGMGAKELCAGAEIWLENGQEELLQFGSRTDCYVKRVEVTQGSVEPVWKYPFRDEKGVSLAKDGKDCSSGTVFKENLSAADKGEICFSERPSALRAKAKEPSVIKLS
ncbi:MAG: hypothetical protein Q8R12_03385 [bacterium]|nr:hypothetical protein [bacterium]